MLRDVPSGATQTEAIMLTRILVVVVVASCVAQPARSEVSPEKETAIHTLMAHTGAADVGVQLGTAMIGQIKPLFPKVPQELWDELATEFDPAEATQLIVPVYDRNFTLDELNELIAFYETALGKKIVRVLPVIVRDSMAITQQWSQQKTQEVMERLAKRGYEPVKL
jgi:hypothetical protein